jgi:hypothetical protein
MHIAKDILEVVTVEAVDHYSLELLFNDGTKRTVDLSTLIKSALPVFEPLKSVSEFRNVTVNPVGGVSWNCGADLSADYLRSA